MAKLTKAQMAQLVAASKAAKRKPSKPRVLPSVLQKPMPVTAPAKRPHKAVMAALLPCPFCRSTKVKLEEGVTYPYVRCDDCNAHGPYVWYSNATTFASTKSGSPEQATCIKLWNAASR